MYSLLSKVVDEEFKNFPYEITAIRTKICQEPIDISETFKTIDTVNQDTASEATTLPEEQPITSDIVDYYNESSQGPKAPFNQSASAHTLPQLSNPSFKEKNVGLEADKALSRFSTRPNSPSAKPPKTHISSSSQYSSQTVSHDTIQLAHHHTSEDYPQVVAQSGSNYSPQDESQEALQLLLNSMPEDKLIEIFFKLSRETRHYVRQALPLSIMHRLTELLVNSPQDTFKDLPQETPQQQLETMIDSMTQLFLSHYPEILSQIFPHDRLKKLLRDAPQKTMQLLMKYLSQKDAPREMLSNFSLEMLQYLVQALSNPAQNTVHHLPQEIPSRIMQQILCHIPQVFLQEITRDKLKVLLKIAPQQTLQIIVKYVPEEMLTNMFLNISDQEWLYLRNTISAEMYQHLSEMVWSNSPQCPLQKSGEELLKKDSILSEDLVSRKETITAKNMNERKRMIGRKQRNYSENIGHQNIDPNRQDEDLNLRSYDPQVVKPPIINIGPVPFAFVPLPPITIAPINQHSNTKIMISSPITAVPSSAIVVFPPTNNQYYNTTL